MQTQSTTLSGLVDAETEIDFEAVYQNELPRAYNFFRYQLGDDHLAEDLTAATFEKAWRHRQRYQKDLASFSIWLFTIARRVAADHYRKGRNTISQDEASLVSDKHGVEELVQKHADFAFPATLLARLAEHERELVALKYGAGLTNRAIASISGLSESNVSTILHRVTQKLREEWDTNYER
jgi:RNA polymerase sigma-70 factor (ECF subfamily)